MKSNADFIKGINKFIKTYNQDKLTKSGVTLNTSEKDGKYFGCKIGSRHYWLLFQDERTNRPGKCFIHLYDDLKDKPSVVQFTIDNSNFQINNNEFFLIQNRGTTIGKRILGFENEFKTLMVKNGFSSDRIIAKGDSIKPNYEDIIEQIFNWLKIRVKTKLQLEEKYRNIEDRATETEADLNLDNVGDIESRTEGGKKVFISVRAERDIGNRIEAISIHGLKCKCCGFDFEKKYGVWGKNYIEVHHVIPLNDGKQRATNPKTDLTVLCANCHRMIHRKKNITLTIDELKQKIIL
jgi:5-methylcytosine-specific restriction enzyme A